MIKPEIYRSLGLSDQEYQKILKILGREPTSRAGNVFCGVVGALWVSSFP